MYDFKAVEEVAREIWKKHKKGLKESVQDNPKKPLFSFLEGPPTANAPLDYIIWKQEHSKI
jgi:isoleucyl-tRNA synthetase